MTIFGSWDKAFGWGMVIFSVLATAAGVIWFKSADAPIPFSFAAFTGLVFLIGILLIVTDWIEDSLQIMDEIEAFPHAFGYHLDQFKQGQPTRAFYMWLGTIILSLFTTYLIFKYDKWTHTLFFGMSAVVIGLTVSCVLAWAFLGTTWFQQRVWDTPFWWYGLVAIAILLAAGLGIYFTEPIEYGGPTQWDIDARGRPYNYEGTRVYTSHFFWSSPSSSSSSSSGAGFSFDCDDDACIGLIIIVIVIILVIASATTPHFWVAATIILCTLLFIISTRELYTIDTEYLKPPPDETVPPLVT